MSCEPPVNGRVSAIKSQFESLSGVESLDIGGCRTRKPAASVRFQFQRSATSLDIVRQRTAGKVREQLCTSWTSSSSSSTSSRRNNEVPKQNSDSALLESRRSVVAKQPGTATTTTSPINSNRSPLKRTSREAGEVKLSRHTSDPVKRSSIKRSPAFRVGEKQNKTVLVKQSSLEEDSSTTPPPPPADKKFERFLVRKCSKENMARLQQVGLSDSLKAALRQPLPAGPPPKKPPRTFSGSPESSIPEQEAFEFDQHASMPSSPDTMDTENAAVVAVKNTQLQDRIHFLESNLAMQSGPKTHLPAVKHRTPLQKSKTELVLQGTKLLNCISCIRDSTPVYDSVNTVAEGGELQPLILQKSLSTCLATKKKPHEHIYMEPFGHLKKKKSVKCSKLAMETDAVKDTDTEDDDGENGTSSSCACPENHKSRADSHYLCTAINDRTRNVDNAEKEASISLEKTYDEINILLNAAFQQRLAASDNSSMNSKTSNDDTENRDSTKLSRSLTEKRKDYVRRVSIVPNCQIHNYGTVHQTFKPSAADKIATHNTDTENNNQVTVTPSTYENTKKTSDRIKQYKQLFEDTSIKKSEARPLLGSRNRLQSRHLPEELADDVSGDDIDPKGDADDDDDTAKLFQVCILVGYNTSTAGAYLKLKYPPNEPIPDNIEQLVFPSSNLIRSGKDNQEYCLILTDDNGFKVYGYCRRIMPEKSEMCLPLAYCIVSVTKALGFYQKILKEIESRHGQSDTQLRMMLRNIQHAKLPEAGKYLHVKLPLSLRQKPLFASNHKISPKRLSLEANPKWLTESATQAAFATDSGDSSDAQKVQYKRQSSGNRSLMEEFEEKKQHQAPFDLSLINRSLIARDPRFDEILIRRPNDLRLENTELSDLLECLGAELLINIFASLLHERKVILQGTNLSFISKAILALDTILYPFHWQYTIVTILPQSLIEICQAPFPVLVGVLDKVTFEIEDGILVDMDRKEIVQSCGDEHIIVPVALRKSLQLSLEMVDLIDQGKMLSSVLISESFLRFFVELFADMDIKRFHKDDFIQSSHHEQHIKFFLEWFLETSMFRHFYNARCDDASRATTDATSDCDSFYKLFDARLMEKSVNKAKTSQNIETIVKNSKIINKKSKTFKDRFKKFLS